MAVVVRNVIPDIGLPAVYVHIGDDVRARRVVDQKTLDIPDDFSAFLLVQFAGLRGEQLIHLGIAVLRIIALRFAGIVLDDIAVGIVDTDAGDVQSDRVILPREPRIPLGVSKISSSPAM